MAEIDRYRSLLEPLGAGSFDALYGDWQKRGEHAVAAYASTVGRPARSVGQLVTERLKFDYSQFGSLPGVA